MTEAEKPFWERELHTLDGELDDAPISAQWRGQLGEHALAQGAKTIGGNPMTDRLQAVAARVSRPANVVRNTDGGPERTLYVGWSDGTKVNNPSDSTIYLSPDHLLENKDGSVDEEIVVDAMTGQVLLAGTMKRTINRKAWAEAQAASGNKPASTIWRAFETAIARQDVLKNWPGCADYFKRHAEQTAASKEEVQKAIDELRPSPELAAAAMAWNIQYPANKLTLPPKYQRAVEKAVKYLDRKHRPDERYQMCAEVATMLGEALTEPPPPPPPEPPKMDEHGDEREGAGEPTEPTKDEPTDKGEDKPEDKSETEITEEPEREHEPDDKEADVPKDREPEHESEEGREEEPEPEPANGAPTDCDGGSDTEPKDDGGDAGDAGESDEQGSDGIDGGSEGNAGEPESGGTAAEPVDPDPDDTKPEGPAPDVTDGGLFGEELDNERAPKEFLPEKMEVDGGAGKGGGEAEIRPPDELVKHSSTTVAFIEEGNPAAYVAMVRAMQPQINAIQAAMRFRNNDRSSFNRGCTSGDLDEGSLHKLILNENNPAIWERRELIGQPKVAVGLLIDESGSMGACRGSKSYIECAKDVAVAMAAALEKIKGVQLMVLGHSGPDAHEYASGTKTVKFSRESKGRSSRDQLDMFEYFTINHKNPWAIPHACQRGGNYDSFAMDYSVRKMIKDYQAFERKLLFVISDGEPSSSGGYGGAPAMKHMRQVYEWGRRRNVMVYGIGICNAYSQAQGEMMYGKGGFVILEDVMSSLSILTAFLKQISARS